MSTQAPLTAGINNTKLPPGWHLNGFYFDAWLRLQHNTSLTMTSHPVETGAAITDHSFVNPRRFSFEIGMTDCASSVYRYNNQQGGIDGSIQPSAPANPTRSVNAYNLLVSMQASRQPLTLASKYGTFSDLLIESITTFDDFGTQEAMRAEITLSQIIITDLKFFKTSNAPDITGQTNRGQVYPQPVNESILYQWFGAVIPE